MPLVTVNSKEDFEKLKKLATLRQGLFKQNIEDKIEKQTFDADLAEQYAPITKATQNVIDKQDKTLKAIEGQTASQNEQSLALQQALAEIEPSVNTINNYITNEEQDGEQLSVSIPIITGLSPLLTTSNKVFRLSHLGGVNFSFPTSGINVTIENDAMIFEDGNEVQLSSNIINALTNNKNDLSKFSVSELKHFNYILKKIRYKDNNRDRKSPRNDAIEILPQTLQQIERNEHNQRSQKKKKKKKSEDEDEDAYGSGFSHTFLSSDPNELLERLEILIGEKEAGNDNIKDEATAILDELLRQNEIDKDQYKEIFSQNLN